MKAPEIDLRPRGGIPEMRRSAPVNQRPNKPIERDSRFVTLWGNGRRDMEPRQVLISVPLVRWAKGPDPLKPSLKPSRDPLAVMDGKGGKDGVGIPGRG